MKQLKVMLSPNFTGEEYHDEVSGLVFRQSSNIEVRSIDLNEHKLSGIQTALRKNILIPYDRATLEFVNGKNIVAAAAPVQEEKVEEKAVEVKEEPKVEEKVEEKVEKKPTKKRNSKKAE